MKFTRARAFVVIVAIALTAAACGGKSVGGGDIGTPTTVPTNAPTTSDLCKTTTLKATEVGVSPTTITVTVIADTGSPLRPGVFQGSVDAVKAWAQYVNDNGGLACRKVVVNSADSHLTADDARNALTTACGNSIATVGTTALFLDDMSPAEQCKGLGGKVSGMPDLAVSQTVAAQACSPLSFASQPDGASCPYDGSGPRTFRQATVAARYYLSKYGTNAMHGLYLVPSDLPSTISATTPMFQADKQLGIKEDAEFGISALTPQSGYTPYVQAIKSHDSTYARDGSDYVSTVFLRKEAQVQGVSSVKAWDCAVQCYDTRLISTGGSAVEGQYVWVSFLPFEDRGHNAELDALLKYDKKPDAFGALAWVDGEIFATAVNAVVAKSGPNGLTRAALLTAIRGIKDYDDNGFISPTDIGAKQNAVCLIGMQVQNGKFVRVHPEKRGTFDCTADPVAFTMDPVKAYKG